MNYWLFKSEPSDYSFENFISDKETCWEGIRNYQARNFIRDNIKSSVTSNERNCKECLPYQRGMYCYGDKEEKYYYM